MGKLWDYGAVRDYETVMGELWGYRAQCPPSLTGQQVGVGPRDGRPEGFGVPGAAVVAVGRAGLQWGGGGSGGRQAEAGERKNVN